MEVQLIQRDDIEKYHSISKNFNNDRVNVSIMTAQKGSVKMFLGDALYYDMIENRTDAKYVALLDGGEYSYQGYTIYFSGVKELIACYAYAEVINSNTMRVTNKGNKNKLDSNSNEVSDSYRNTKTNDANSEAIRIQREVAQFLDQNKSDYPLFGRVESSPRETGFQFWKV